MTKSEQTALFKQHLPMVNRIVGGFLRKVPRNVLREDLIAAGQMGLWEAVTKGAIGDNFEWYAMIRIRGAILDELRRQDWAPRRARWTETSTFSMLHLENEEDLYIDPVIESSPEEFEKVATAIQTLPERLKEIMILNLVQGVKLKDIAVKLGVSAPRISQLHSKAIDHIRKAVA